MSKRLVIVESPTKARTISRFLGAGVQVMASQGHIRDLPQKELGVDIDHDFRPTYELTLNGRKTVKNLKAAVSGADDIYLATDPDREGEAIAWHLKEVLKGSGKSSFYRITFHEITQSAIERSFNNPGDIAYDMVDAQQARRVLDRIVGYQVSPMLWRHIQKGTSAGRVQTVALRLVVEREKEIRAFTPVEYWNLDALFGTREPKASFKARLARINEDKVQISCAESAALVADALMGAGVTHRISTVNSTPHKKTAPPPFITSTLQQAAGSALHMGTSQTMRIAQELYEGIDLGSGQVGLITYMRTDSVNIAKEAQTQALEYIRATYGPEYLPEKPNIYRSRKTAQEAHEAIRPTSMKYAPDAIAAYLTPQQLKIYRLIWNRFIASQMAPAQMLNHLIEVTSSGGDLVKISSKGLIASDAASTGIECTFRAVARETVFPGFLKVYSFKEIGEEDDAEMQFSALPKLAVGSLCDLLKLDREQCFTQPPSRFTEASLVKALEQNGVGRPSTYATTVNTIQERKYVSREKGSLIPTELGIRVCDYLVQQMPQLFDIGFTAQMEDELDQVEEGHLNWVKMLHEFYENFLGWLGGRSAVEQMPSDEAFVALLNCFTPDFKFDEPVSHGAKKYDDARFINSMRDRHEKGKALTERQWGAFLFTISKYAAQHPEMTALLEKYGYLDKVRAIQESASSEPEIIQEPVAPEVQALLKAMEGITYNQPRKRGGKTYDDEKFVKSLRAHCDSGRALSVPQTMALLRIAANYSAAIPGYAEISQALADKFGIEKPAPKSATPKEASSDSAPEANVVSAEDAAKAAPLMEMVGEIKEWAPPVSKGRFRFDDRKFAESVMTQYRQKGQVSPKQFAALQKMVSKYKSQIANFDERFQVIAAAEREAPQQLDEVCPLCGAPLVLRKTRGSSFKGCSAFPKCRYSAKIN